jgi:ABC-type multidrug transport system fused ATPase/permease subunit
MCSDWNLINNNFQNLVSVLNAFTRAAGAASRVLSLMDNQPDIHPEHGNKPAEFHGDIHLHHIGFSYQMRPDKKVINDVSLHIPPGSTCALVGRSGAGKSSLVHLILRYYDVHSGVIEVDGIPLTEWQPLHYRSHIGLVAQDSTLFACSIEENIAYGLLPDQYTKADIITAAKAANCHNFILEMEDGYQTKVGERGVRLSGGQKQRIAIARAILRKPQLLLLDEATSALE